MLYYVHNCNSAKLRARNIKRLSNRTKNMSYQTSSTTKFNSLFGTFDIIIKNKHTNPKAIFLFYNNIEDKITHFMIYEGKSFYRYFNRFITETIEDLEKKVKNKNSKSIVLVPQNTINKTNISILKEKLNIYIEEYKIRDSGLPKVIHNNKNEILSKFPSSEFHIKKVSEIVHKLNLNLHIIKKHIGKVLPSNIRSYSTLSKSYKKKSSIVKPTLALIPYSSKNYSTVPEKKVNIIPYSRNGGQDLNEYRIRKLRNNWKSFTSKNDYSAIGIVELKTELDNFFVFYRNEYPEHKYFAIIFKIMFRNGAVRSCSTTQIAHVEDFNRLLSIFSIIFLLEDLYDKVSDDERELLLDDGIPSGKIIFDFKTMISIKGTKYEDLIPLKEKNKKMKEDKGYTKTLNYKGFKIPTHMDLTLWSNITFSEDFKNAHAIYRGESVDKQEYIIDFMFHLNEDNYYCTVMNKGNVLFTFIDTLKDRHILSNFERVITENKMKKTYFYSDGELLFYQEDRKATFIENIPKSFKTQPKILTLDLETRDIGGVKVPICMSIYDGKKATSFLFKDSNKWEEEMLKGIKTIMTRKYDGYKIYVHNLSYFDSIFMLDTLSKLGEIKPLMRDNRFIKINFIFYAVSEKGNKNTNRKYRLVFYDSYLLLPASLSKLSESFNIKNRKSIFPFDFVNRKDFDFNYNSHVPEYKYFPGSSTESFTIKNYNEYCGLRPDLSWNFEKELSSYCEIDTIALHQIILKFHGEIYHTFKIDITKYPTLPSIAFGIYRSNFIPKDKIPKILGKLHYTIKESYYGGITEIYRPYGKNIHSFDVNSLYPYSMKKYPMPVGKTKHFKGNIINFEKNPFGFFKVRVSAPIDMKIPILPRKLRSKNGTRTIFPVGTWTGWYFSEEIKNAEKFGYKFEILEGYLFEKDKIFSGYVDTLYKLKVSVESTDPRYFIAKLLMNALYGRFGLNPVATETRIVSPDISEKILEARKNVSVIPLLSGSVITTYDKTNDDEVDITNISIPISSAIAAYSRIEMSHFLTKYKNNIYAVDTDGIKVDCMLSPSEIDNKELGKMKYEYTFKEAVFPAPKVYGGLLEKPYKKYKNELTKVKGLKSSISYAELKSVLNKGKALKFLQEKWKRVVAKSSIIVDMETYTLSLTESKRELIFDSWGDLVDTIPFYLNEGVLIKRIAPPLYCLVAPFLVPLNMRVCGPIERLSLPAPAIVLPEPQRVIYIHPSYLYAPEVILLTVPTWARLVPSELLPL